jgi:hypothetical protein
MLPPPPPPPELLEDVVGEILLRLSPDEPAYLVRASLVCKLWYCIVSDRSFLRRYRRFHRTPPLLGFFDEIFSCSFVPITEALPFSKVAFDCRPWHPIDCHHSRVLLYKDSVLCGYFLVWDPITGEREQVREASSWGRSCDSAVVLCATAGCDHCDCHGGPFLIVSVSTCRVRDSVEARVYSSQVGAWGDLVSVQLDVILNCDWNRIDLSGALVGDGVHFLLALSGGDKIVK